MAKTITEAVEQAIEVIRTGKHYDRIAFVAYWGKRATDYGFFFAKSQQEAEEHRVRVERAERTQYTIICSVNGANYDPDAEEEF